MNRWLLIVGMMLVTFVPRYLPLAFVNRFNLLPFFIYSLSYIPVAVLSAIVAQNFFIENTPTVSLDNNCLIVGMLAVFIALTNKSFLRTVIVGLIVFGF
jgi:branched-subunit amino acid transport protein